MKTQFGVSIKILRSDNGSEFLNAPLKALLDSLGVIHQTSCVYTPQQNGKVERKHRHLLNVAKALRFQASLPIHFWGDCLLAATYLINRTPTPLLSGQSPFEVLFHKPPSYNHLKVFGCLCYATIVPHQRDKFASRAIKGVFLGYPYGTKGYRVLDLETKSVFISRDVQFVEHIFPF